MRKCIFFIIFGILSLSTFTVAQEGDVLDSEIKDDCDLQEAVDLALRKNPELIAFSLKLDTADARIKQAGLWPNPIFEAESENFSGDNPGFNQAENTFGITQPFLMGGNIQFKKNIAVKEKEILQLRYEATKISLITEVEHAVYDILLAQKKLEFTIEAQIIAKNIYDFNLEKGINKDSAPHQLLSAEIELSQAKLEVLNMEKNLEIAKRNLTILWGTPEILLGECKGSLDKKFIVPKYNELKECLLESNPEIKAIKQETKRINLLLRSAKAERIPDVELGFGIRRFEEDSNHAFVAGLSVPLPLFNRNQGSIKEALVNQKIVEVDGNTIRNRLLYQLNEAHRTFQTTLHQVNVFKDTVLPKTEQYFKLTKKGYYEGAFEYLEVLEAQRTLVETKKSYVEALHTLQTSVANLERLCSRHFHDTKGEMI